MIYYRKPNGAGPEPGKPPDYPQQIDTIVPKCYPLFPVMLRKIANDSLGLESLQESFDN